MTIEELHAEASRLVKEWYPDTIKYPRERRNAELALMGMLLALESLESRK